MITMSEWSVDIKIFLTSQRKSEINLNTYSYTL